MFAHPLQAINQYRNVGTATAVSQACPHKLIMLLFDGAIAAVLQARHAISDRDMPTKITTLSKAMRIIDEGLKAAVQGDTDPALAANLCALYDHMSARLLTANIHNDDAPLAEVARLLGDLRSTWAEIDPTPSARADVQA